MKWEMYAIGMAFIFVMLMFGMMLISQGEASQPNSTAEDPGYQSIATSVDLLFGGMNIIPWALGIIGAIAVFAYLNRKY